MIVRFVVCPVVHTLALPLRTNLPEPNAIARTFELEESNLNPFRVLPARSIVPFVSVTIPAVVRFPLSVHDPPTPLNVIGAANATPFDWMVCAVVALKVNTEVADQTGVTLEMAMLPEITSAPVLENVNVPSVTVKSRHLTAPIIGTSNVPA